MRNDILAILAAFVLSASPALAILLLRPRLTNPRPLFDSSVPLLPACCLVLFQDLVDGLRAQLGPTHGLRPPVTGWYGVPQHLPHSRKPARIVGPLRVHSSYRRGARITPLRIVLADFLLK